MPTFPSTAFVRQFGTIQRLVQREQVAVTSHGKVVGYYISTEDGELLRQAKAARAAYHPRELSEDMWRDIDAAHPPEHTTSLNHLLED